MKCPFCDNDDSQVKDSRSSEDGSAIRRRRECTKCDSRFTTFERVQLRDLTVIKSNGKREPFSRDKLVRSMHLCLQKRPVDEETVERSASEIIRQLEKGGDADVASQKIGELTLDMIASLDLIAYVRYASVYEDFRDVEDFNKLLKDFDTKYKN